MMMSGGNVENDMKEYLLAELSTERTTEATQVFGGMQRLHSAGCPSIRIYI